MVPTQANATDHLDGDNPSKRYRYLWYGIRKRSVGKVLAGTHHELSHKTKTHLHKPASHKGPTRDTLREHRARESIVAWQAMMRASKPSLISSVRAVMTKKVKRKKMTKKIKRKNHPTRHRLYPTIQRKRMSTIHPMRATTNSSLSFAVPPRMPRTKNSRHQMKTKMMISLATHPSQ